MEATLNPFKDQDIPDSGVTNPPDRYGEQVIGAKEMQIGFGSTVFRADQSGIWLGGKDFASAPFSVDMEGNVTATSITLGGYIPTGGAAADVNANVTTINGGQITTNSITASKISVSNLSSISANIGAITAGTIDGVTITGGVVQTSSSGLRIVLDGTTDKILFQNSGTTYASMYPSAGGVNIGMSIETLSGSSGAQLILNEGTSNNFAGLYFNSQGITVDYSLSIIDCDFSLRPSSDASYDLGTDSNAFRNLYLDSVGSVTSGGSASTPFPSSWSVSHPATGRYTITHNFGTTDYAVIVTTVVSVAKIWTIESKGSNSFTVRIANTSFSLEDNAFDFIVIRS